MFEMNENNELTVLYRKANKHAIGSEWNAKALFSGFKYRIVLRHCEAIIEAYQRLAKLKKRLTTDIGPEGERWFIDQNNKDEFLYLRDNMIILQWKMTATEDFKNWFEYIEQHTDSEEELERQRKDEEEEQEKRRLEMEAERQRKMEEYYAQQNAKNTPIVYNGKPEDYEYTWIMTTGSYIDKYIVNCSFAFVKKGTSDICEVDYDLTQYFTKQTFGDDVVYSSEYNLNNTRKYLNDLGFTENKNIQMYIDESRRPTNEHMSYYEYILQYQSKFNEMIGLGIVLYVPVDPDDANFQKKIDKIYSNDIYLKFKMTNVFDNTTESYDKFCEAFYDYEDFMFIENDVLMVNYDECGFEYIELLELLENFGYTIQYDKNKALL